MKGLAAAIRQDRDRGKRTLAESPRIQRGAPWARGPSRTRTVELVTRRAARLIDGGMTAPQAANWAIHEWSLRFSESGHFATMLVEIVSKAQTLADQFARDRRAAKRGRSGFQNAPVVKTPAPRPPGPKPPVPAIVLQRRAMMARVARWGQSLG